MEYQLDVPDFIDIDDNSDDDGTSSNEVMTFSTQSCSVSHFQNNNCLLFDYSFS